MGQTLSLAAFLLILAYSIYVLVGALRTGSYPLWVGSVLGKPFDVSRREHPRTFRLLLAVNGLMILAFLMVVGDSTMRIIALTSNTSFEGTRRPVTQFAVGNWALAHRTPQLDR
jgi:hypothetical protein